MRWSRRRPNPGGALSHSAAQAVAPSSSRGGITAGRAAVDRPARCAFPHAPSWNRVTGLVCVSRLPVSCMLEPTEYWE
eukprot:4065501-Lingulodinium_polyedra.AAC.1